MQIIHKGKPIETPKSGLGQMVWGMLALLLIVFAAFKGVLTGQLTWDFDSDEEIPYDVYPIENE